MAVLIEAYSVIIRVHAIREKYFGGVKAFMSDIPNSTFCTDGSLARAGFMSLGGEFFFSAGLTTTNLYTKNEFVKPRGDSKTCACALWEVHPFSAQKQACRHSLFFSPQDDSQGRRVVDVKASSLGGPAGKVGRFVRRPKALIGCASFAKLFGRLVDRWQAPVYVTCRKRVRMTLPPKNVLLS